MKRLFGTDGVRGIANLDLTPELAFQLGWAGAQVLTEACRHQPTILVGQDGRLSGDMLESALVAGICSAGAHAMVIGIIPTPGVSYLCRAYGCDAGVMISASHNSYEFNGIKFFSHDGYKLPDETEDQIENLIQDPNTSLTGRQAGDRLGRRFYEPDAAQVYGAYLKNVMGLDCTGMTIALDCANGASAPLAPGLFEQLGARVFSTGVMPDGTNINAGCGTLHLDGLSQLVRAHQCDLGLAFDGDADRMLAVDETGAALDGDVLMAIIALDMQRRKTLKNNTLVTTVMSNLGLDMLAKDRGLSLIHTQVGDRYVLEAMRAQGLNFGGEQSGHMILLDHSRTGDGLLSALRLLHALTDQKQSLAEASKVMTVFPQVLKAVTVDPATVASIMNDPVVEAHIEATSRELADRGRVLVRPSGTEPLIRVMIEGEQMDKIEMLADHLIQVIASRTSNRQPS